jgi:hypothetical protein
MAGGQSYQVQQEALRELEHHLQRVINDVGNVSQGYGVKLQDLLGRGLPLEVHDKVQMEFQTHTQNLLSQAQAITANQAIPYVRQEIQRLS